MGVLFDLKRPRDPLFNGAAQAMQRANARVAQITEHQCACYARRNHLVIDHVRRHANQRQIAASLADDLVSGGKADESGKAFNRHRQVILDILGNRFFQGETFIYHGNLFLCIIPPSCGIPFPVWAEIAMAGSFRR